MYVQHLHEKNTRKEQMPRELQGQERVVFQFTTTTIATAFTISNTTCWRTGYNWNKAFTPPISDLKLAKLLEISTTGTKARRGTTCGKAE